MDEVDEYGCGWNEKACYASQLKHGRGDDCPTHPWPCTSFLYFRGGYYSIRTSMSEQDLIASSKILGETLIALTPLDGSRGYALWNKYDEWEVHFFPNV